MSDHDVAPSRETDKLALNVTPKKATGAEARKKRLTGTPKSPMFKDKAVAQLVKDFDSIGNKAKNPRVKAIRLLMTLVQKFPNKLRDISDFQFDRRIGKGGFGEVWLGNDLRTGKIVAIKELYTEQLTGRNMANFCREIYTMCEVKSRFAVPFVGYTIEPPYSIITEYMPNGSLFYFTNRTQRKFQLSGTHMSIIAMCIAHGMASIKASHIIHRDLKSANILLDANRLPLICDFGVARFILKSNRMTPVVGTFTHMAPEVMTGGNYHYAVDVYSYGMILYEMAEGRNPFLGVKPAKDLLTRVPNGFRPIMRNESTPKPLVELMMRCWDAEPTKRPLWSEIFELFMQGSVYFEGTDKSAVLEFGNSIKASLKQDGTFYNEGEDDDTDAVVDYVMVMKRLAVKLQKVLETVDAEGNDIVEVSAGDEDGDEGSDGELNSTHLDESFANRSDVVLRDASNPLFEKALEYLTGVITPKQFRSLYAAVNSYFRDEITNETAVRKCLGAFIKLGERDVGFLKVMSKLHFFTSLPVGESLMDTTFEFVALVFMKAPNVIDQTMKRVLSSIITKRPVDAAQLLAIYAKNASTVEDPYPAVDLFIQYAREFYNNTGGATIVNALCYLIHEVSNFKQERMNMIRPVFSAYCRSKCAETAKAAITGIVNNFDKKFKIPFDAIYRNLSNPASSNIALSLLMRVSTFPASRTLSSALIDRAVAKPSLFPILWNFAACSEDTALLFVHNTSWMKSTAPEAFNLFLILFQRESLRSQLVFTHHFATFMARMAATESRDIIVAIPPVLRRCELNQAILDALTTHTFFKRYHSAVRTFSTDLSVMRSCATLLDRVARVGFSPSFKIFLPTLVRMLKHVELRPSSVSVFASFSCHSSLVPLLRNQELTGYLRSLAALPQFEKHLQMFFSNCEKVSQ